MEIRIDTDICFECGNKRDEMHHVVPKSRGGTKMIPLCSICHGLAHGINRKAGHSMLTKEGLRKRKDVGVVLGKPENLKQEHRLKGAEAMRLKALNNEMNQQATALIIEYRAKGMSYDKIAEQLTTLNFKTANNKEFTSTGVMRLYKRHIEIN